MLEHGMLEHGMLEHGVLEHGYRIERTGRRQPHHR